MKRSIAQKEYLWRWKSVLSYVMGICCRTRRGYRIPKYKLISNLRIMLTTWFPKVLVFQFNFGKIYSEKNKSLQTIRKWTSKARSRVGREVLGSVPLRRTIQNRRRLCVYKSFGWTKKCTPNSRLVFHFPNACPHDKLLFSSYRPTGVDPPGNPGQKTNEAVCLICWLYST